MHDEILRLDRIHLEEKGNTIFNNIHLSVKMGEIHGVLSMNSYELICLRKVITGLVTPGVGYIFLYGQERRFLSQAKTYQLGIRNLADHSFLNNSLSVAQNLYVVSCYPGRHGWYHGKKEIRKFGREILNRYQWEMDPGRRVGELTGAQRHMMDLICADLSGARLILSAETFASFEGEDLEAYRRLILWINGKGTSFIFLGSNPELLAPLCNPVTLLRNGVNVATHSKPYDMDKMRVQIATSAVRHEYQHIEKPVGDPVLELWAPPAPKGDGRPIILHKGEIRGVYHKYTKGQDSMTDLLRGEARLFGYTMSYQGKPLKPKTYAQLMNMGIWLLNSVQDKNTIFDNLSLAQNIALYIHKKTKEPLLKNYAREEELLLRAFLKEHPDIDPHKTIAQLSNYEKTCIVMYRFFIMNPKVLICDNPYSSLDLLSKDVIDAYIKRMAANGTGVVIFTSKRDELDALPLPLGPQY